MYVVVVDEDNDEDDKGSHRRLGKDGDNGHDRHGGCQGGHKRGCRWGHRRRCGGACIVLRANLGGRRASTSAKGDPPPECLNNFVGIGDKRPIIVDGADIDVDVDADLVMEVWCASLVRSLRRMLLVLCKAAGGVAPTYMWE